MKPILLKLKPTSGFSYILHLSFLLILPIAAYLLVTIHFVQLALSLIVLSKWRMFAVRPRFWAANIRANSIDLIVGLSLVLFMDHSTSLLIRLLWVVLYAVWLVYLKPASSTFMVSVQAFIGQLVALMALYLIWSNGPIYGLTALTGLFCFLAARHFLEAFDEPYDKLLAYIWGYFGASLAWLLSHWLLFYRGVSLTTLLLSALGYGLSALYYLDHENKLSKLFKRQIIIAMIVIVGIAIIFSGWGNKVV